jgi:hypothetical protein
MSKKLLILSILMLLVVPFAGVNAQNMAEGSIDYCAILPEADCQILVQSEAAMGDVSSMAFDMSIAYDIAMSGDDMPPGMDNINFAIDGTGAVAIDKAAFDEIYSLAASDMSAYFEQMPSLIDGMIAGIDGEMTLNISLPEMLGMAMGGDVPSNIPVNLIMKDGVWALDVASLSEAMGEDSGGMGWVGINLNGAFESIFAEAGMDFGELMDEETMNMMSDMNNMDLTSAVTITRLPDSDVNGTSVAVFEVNLDYAALMDAMMSDGAIAEMYEGMGMSQEEIDAAMSILDTINLTYRQYVGLEDYYGYRYEYMMSMALDGEAMGDDTLDSMSMVIDMSFDLSDFNVPVEVEVPADAMVMPFEMIMGGGL